MQGFVKTKVGITIATIIFLALILLGELSPLSELFPRNEITREGISKFRIHILKIPQLKKIVSKSSDINSTVVLKQLGRSRVFRAWGGEKFFDYFYLNQDWQFEKPKVEELEKLLKDKSVVPHYDIDFEKDSVLLKKNDSEEYELTLKESLRKNYLKVSSFNKQNSLMFN